MHALDLYPAWATQPSDDTLARLISTSKQSFSPKMSRECTNLSSTDTAPNGNTIAFRKVHKNTHKTAHRHLNQNLCGSVGQVRGRGLGD